MADNTPQPKSGPMPPLPSSGMTRPLPSTTTQLPAIKKGSAGKIVVMLSSVAKSAPGPTQALPGVVPLVGSPAKEFPSLPPQAVRRPPPLPLKQISATPPLRLNATTHVQIPPKSSLPRTGLLAAPIIASNDKGAPPPLPPKRNEPIRVESKRPGAQHIPPIKLNMPSEPSDTGAESIFLSSSAEPPVVVADRTGTKEPAPVEPSSSEGLLNAEPATPAHTLLNEPPAFRPARQVNPPPLPLAKPAESVAAPPPTFHVVPPLLEREPEPPAEKLRPPHLSSPVLKDETRPDAPSSPAFIVPPQPPAEKLRPPHLPSPVLKDETRPDAPPSPALIVPPQPSAEKLRPPHLPSPALKDEMRPDAPLSPALIVPPPPRAEKPMEPLAQPVSAPVSKPAPREPKPMESVPLLKKTTPLVVSSSASAPPMPKAAEAKPALKPPVLPRRSLAQAAVSAEAPQTELPLPAKVAGETKAAQPAPFVAVSAVEKTAAAGAAKTPTAPAKPLPTVPVTGKAALPLTRAARAKKRRLVDFVSFYVFFAFAMVGLFFGGLYFGRETRVEGQIIPPAGMVLNNEVWVVTDFRALAAGVAEDLAAERAPLMQEIQERQEHVQRSQADVAAREERIRLIQQEVDAAQADLVSIGKQSREATQKIWDEEGGAIDAEYTSRLNQLQRAIADRAKSLNLKYQPDPAFPSPEVWANAYRLALYDVPASVDGVKEHQWLSDQMKLWRDFLKTLDDRKSQLRDKAAAITTAIGPKVSDAQAKMDSAKQRIDATTAEEVPLKAELQQAQTDLAAAQTAEQGLDEKYYKQLDALPATVVTKHIPVEPNGRFSWLDDDIFAEGEKEHNYWIFSCATRSDGRQYWSLAHFRIHKNDKVCLLIDPESFVSTKAILRPNLSPEEQDQ
jgi:hypothetical protein